LSETRRYRPRITEPTIHPPRKISAPAVRSCSVDANGRPSPFTVNTVNPQPRKNTAAMCATACAVPPTKRYVFERVSVNSQKAKNSSSAQNAATGLLTNALTTCDRVASMSERDMSVSPDHAVIR